MSREEVFEKLNNIFRDCFDDKSIVVTDDLVASDIDGWDSFEHINLMNTVQNEFGINIPMSKIITMSSVKEMVDVIMELVNQ